MRVVFITRTDASKMNDLRDQTDLEDLIKEVGLSGIKDIFILSKIKESKVKLFGVSVNTIYDKNPTGATSINTLLNKIKIKFEAFIACSKEVGLRERNIKYLIKEIEQTDNLLVAGYKFVIKDRKLNNELRDFYENDNLIAYKVPWNTCAIWNYDLFIKHVGKFDEITAINPFKPIGVSIDGACSLTPHVGMEDGLAIAQAVDSDKKIKFILLDDFLFWDVDSNSKIRHREKLARKDTVLRNFMGVRNYSVEDLKVAGM